jgi:hypothetical protein
MFAIWASPTVALYFGLSSTLLHLHDSPPRMSWFVVVAVRHHPAIPKGKTQTPCTLRLNPGFPGWLPNWREYSRFARCGWLPAAWAARTMVEGLIGLHPVWMTLQPTEGVRPYVRKNRQMRPSNAVRTVWNAEAIDTSHLISGHQVAIQRRAQQIYP